MAQTHTLLGIAASYLDQYDTMVFGAYNNMVRRAEQGCSTSIYVSRAYASYEGERSGNPVM